MLAHPYRRGSTLASILLVALMACGEGPVGLENAGSIEELERELEASGHLECRDLVRDLWSQLTTLTRQERLQQIRVVATECVESLRRGHRSLTVATKTTGSGIDADGYMVTVAGKRRRIRVDSAVTFKNLEVGSHQVELEAVAPNCEVVGPNPRTVDVSADRSASTLFEITCSSGGSQDDDPGYVTVACPELSLAAPSGIPLDRIRIGRLPEEFEPPLAARVVPGGGAPSTFTLVEILEDGSAQMVAPIHPSLSVDGGSVELTFTDGTRACASEGFTVAALPPAPGTAEAMVEKLGQIIELQLSGLGVVPAEAFAADPQDLPTPVALLSILHQSLEGSTNANSLASIVRGDAPILDGAPVPPDLLDRILARTGILEDLDEQRNSLEGSISASRSARGVRLSADGFDCDTIGLPDAAELDYCMELASSYAFKRDMGATKKVLDDLAIVFTVGRLIPIPAAQAVSIAGGAAIALRRYALDAVASIHPSHFTSIQFEALPVEFLEDEEGVGVWHSVLVKARSDGFDRDEALLDAVSPFIGEFHDKFFPDGSNLGEALSAVTGNIELLNVPPRDFGPVDLVFGATFGVWSEGEVEGDAIELQDGDSYIPVKAGTADLIVRTRADRFGSASPVEDRKTIEVKQIDLDIEPAEATVKAGETLFRHFTVTVENSVSPELVEIDRSNASMPLQGTASIEYAGSGTHHVSYTAPSTIEVLPDFLTVRHTGETGARAPTYGPPERNATAVIRGGRIVVSPDGICLEPGETQQFQAEVSGVESGQVSWSETGGGGISSTGLLTAPQESGQIEVIATSVENPDIQGRAGIQVGGCRCRWSISVGGGTVTAQPKDHANFSVGSSGSVITGIGFFDENQNPGSSTFTASRTVPVGATGSFPMPVSGTIAIIAPDISYSSGVEADEGPVTTLELTENTSEVLEGILSGAVLVSRFESGMVSERVASFSAEFRITRDPGLSGTDPVSGLEINACEID